MKRTVSDVTNRCRDAGRKIVPDNHPPKKRSRDDPPPAGAVDVSTPLFPPNCSLTNDVKYTPTGQTPPPFFVLTEEETDLWTSTAAAKFAAGRYIPACRKLGVISRTLVANESFVLRKSHKTNSRNKSKSDDVESKEQTTSKKKKKKPPVIPIPTLLQAKRHIMRRIGDEEEDGSEVERLAHTFRQSWSRVQQKGAYSPGWDTSTGELLLDTDAETRTLCRDIHRCMSQAKPTLMDDWTDAAKHDSSVALSRTDSVTSGDATLEFPPVADTVRVLQALIELTVPHPALYDQPLVVTKVNFSRLQEKGTKKIGRTKGGRYRLSIAVYANRLLFECMTQELQIVMDALDPSSFRVDRALVIPPSRRLSSNNFASSEYPKVVIPPQVGYGDRKLHEVIQAEEEEEEDLEGIGVEGSTRCSTNTIDAFTIPGLMKLMENRGTFNEGLWKNTIAPKLQKSDKNDSGGLELELLEHQKHGVCWMYQMERVGNLNHLTWERRSFCEGDAYYYSPALGQLRLVLDDDDQKEFLGKPFGGGGVLCDEMGLGKTVQTVALIVATLDDLKRRVWSDRNCCPFENDQRTYRHATLIVVPPALLQQWISEIKKIAPWLVVDMLVSTSNSLGRVQQPDLTCERSLEADIVLATYTSLEENAKVARRNPFTILLEEQKWGRIVLDEMQEIRSSTKRISQLVNSLRGDCRWMLSGTPLLDSITDLRGELCFLGLEPFSATNDDGYFHFAIASHWEHKSRYGLSVLKQLAELVMLRRSKSMIIQKTGLPLLGLKPLIVTYEPVPQDDSERALYCFLEYVMHSTLDESNVTLAENEKEQAKVETCRLQEHHRNRIAFVRMLREICVSTSLLNGGLGCPSQLDTLNRWMKNLNRRWHEETVLGEEVSGSEDWQFQPAAPGSDPERTLSLRVFSCEEAIRFLSQVEDLVRTDADFVTDVQVGGGGGISSRNRAMESLDERYEIEAAEYERAQDLCASASSRRAKAYWHKALELVTTGKLFADCDGSYDQVAMGFRRLWRWRSCIVTLKVCRGWRPTNMFDRLSLSHDREAALMSLFHRQPRFYWANPYSMILEDIPTSVTRVDVENSIVCCLAPSRNGSNKANITVVELSKPDTPDSWKGIVTFYSKDEFTVFMKMIKSVDGIALKSESVPQCIKDKIEDAKTKLDDCVAVNRVHPSSWTMKALSIAKREYKVAKLGLRIFTQERKSIGHVGCVKALGTFRNASPATASSLFDTAVREVEDARSLLAEQMPKVLRKRKTLDQLQAKMKSGVFWNVCQLTTVEGLRALKEGKADLNLCPICYESLGHDGSLVALTRCGHMCCKACMLIWMQEKELRGERPSCIECRKPVRYGQLVTVDPRKADNECSEGRRKKAKSLVQKAAAALDSNHGQLPPHLWEALYLAIDPPTGVSRSGHHTLTAIPPVILSHIRKVTSMPINCKSRDPGDGQEYKLSSKFRALLSDLPKDEVSVVFASSRTSVIHLLTILKKNGLGCRGLYAGQTERDSEMAIYDWQSSKEALVLVVQAGVAACGLTLTKASNMFLLEPFLRHEEEKQAYARLHRYGQEREVHCKVYYTPVSIEERLLLWRLRFESQNNQANTEETTIFAPIRGVQYEDQDEDQPQELGTQQTQFLLNLRHGTSNDS